MQLKEIAAKNTVECTRMQKRVRLTGLLDDVLQTKLQVHQRLALKRERRSLEEKVSLLT